MICTNLLFSLMNNNLTDASVPYLTEMIEAFQNLKKLR